MSPATRERVARRLEQARVPIPAAYSPRSTGPGSNIRASVVPGGWFGGWLGVSPYWHNVGGGACGPWGVTDGSDAQPGEVGEFIHLKSLPGFSLTPNVAFHQAVTSGVLPPGDWDCWAYCGFSTVLQEASLLLDPLPAGFTNNMLAFSTIVPVTLEGVLLVSLMARALTAAPSMIVWDLGVLSTTAVTGQAELEFYARRRR